MRQSTSTVKLLNIAILFVASLAISMVVCNGQDLTRADLLSCSSNCSHVIDLIHRYGVNQTCDTAGDRQWITHSAFGPAIIPASEAGDLSIASVHQIADIENGCGPKFAVVISNCSTRCVEGFSVTVVGTLGQIHCFSPCTTVKVDKIHPNESLQVEVTLPIEALAMGNRNGQVIGFQRLIVAIDSFDEFVETDEANNLKAFCASTLPILEVQATVTTEVTQTQEQVSQTAPVDNASVSIQENQTLETTQPLTAQPAGQPNVTQSSQAVQTDESADALQTAWRQLNTETATAEVASDG
ncbi:hypothetical protein [Aporhodopirellula aestuarii]|uniref:Secreted protein n=1 Tax=Aporhodopirellula aestuarii TaxID=2950107 RepID=A0ABT0U8P9_9BACT|nr:hypothetical protein [Aporhodopirellula aestuarii]MCM2373295.1 hypothetical protein [Aporhodopirellula aestuarii]